MIFTLDTQTTKRKFIVFKPMLAEDEKSMVNVVLQMGTRHYRTCASWLWVMDDGARFIEHTGE